MTTPLFNREAFAERIGHDDDTFRELIELFIEMQPDRMDLLAQAVAAEALPDVRVQSHALAGTFRNMSLDRLGDCAKALERAAVDADLAAVRDRFLALDGLFADALAELEAVRDVAGEIGS